MQHILQQLAAFVLGAVLLATPSIASAWDMSGTQTLTLHAREVAT